jgi:fatty acid desaturase
MRGAAATLTPEDPLDPGEPVISRTFPRKELVALSRRLSEIEGFRPALAIVGQWLAIAAVIAGAAYVDAWPVWLLAGVLIATRQHALLVLMHEAAHFHMFRSRVASDVVADLFCAFPMNITTAGYRYQHLQHHKHTNTPDDPYWVNSEVDPATWRFPRSRLGALRVYLFDLFGVHTVRHLKIIQP